jgi:shikimate dehydrogenase
MKTFGLVGRPLGHSFSADYFNQKFQQEGLSDCQYELFEIESINKLLPLIQEHDSLQGLTVTIPYKEQVIGLLDEIDPTAEEVGAVNTIRFKGEKLIGYNTDIFGFEQSLVPLLGKQHHHALVLGSGGAAKAVKHVLQRLSIQYLTVSRNPSEVQIGYDQVNADTLEHAKLIVNTTPIGMFPNTDAKPDLPYESVTEEHLFYDLVYNPEETAFLMQANVHGAKTKNGLEMLHLQADKAWDIWQLSD